MVYRKYKLEVYFVTDEEFSSPDDVIDGCILTDLDFRGAITSAKLKVR